MHRIILDLALPQNHDLPTGILQIVHFCRITLLIPSEVLAPVRRVLLGEGQVASGASMPETSVDEHSHSLGGERDVRPAWSSFPILSVTTLSHLAKRAS